MSVPSQQQTFNLTSVQESRRGAYHDPFLSPQENATINKVYKQNLERNRDILMSSPRYNKSNPILQDNITQTTFRPSCKTFQHTPNLYIDKGELVGNSSPPRKPCYKKSELNTTIYTQQQPNEKQKAMRSEGLGSPIRRDPLLEGEEPKYVQQRPFHQQVTYQSQYINQAKHTLPADRQVTKAHLKASFTHYTPVLANRH